MLRMPLYVTWSGMFYEQGSTLIIVTWLTDILITVAILLFKHFQASMNEIVKSVSIAYYTNVQ